MISDNDVRESSWGWGVSGCCVDGRSLSRIVAVLLTESSCAPSDSNDNAAVTVTSVVVVAAVAVTVTSAAASVSVGASGSITGRGDGGGGDDGVDMGEDDREIDELTPRIQHAWSLSSELEYRRPERKIRKMKKSRRWVVH